MSIFSNKSFIYAWMHQWNINKGLQLAGFDEYKNLFFCFWNPQNLMKMIIYRTVVARLEK